jgi:hypothetical protein
VSRVPEIRVRIPNQLYTKLRPYLRNMTWKELIEAALIEYIKNREADPVGKLRWQIVQMYTEAKAVQRVVWMWRRLKDMEDLAERTMTGYRSDRVERILSLALKKRINEGKKLVYEYLKKLREEGYDVDDVIEEIERIEEEVEEYERV